MPSPASFPEGLTGLVLNNIKGLSRPALKITLAGARKNEISCFSTADAIEGLLSITTPQETAFDLIEITFKGEPPVKGV